MKRIILGLSLLLILVQNGFARTDAELDKMIANESDKVWKQIYRCEKASNPNNKYTADINICIKSIEMIDKNSYVLKEGAKKSIAYLNLGVLYEFSKKDYIKTYEYYMKAAKLGNTQAQSNLDTLCREHSWVCK